VPGHPGLDRFLAILGEIVRAAFSFQGMELVVMYDFSGNYLSDFSFNQ